MRSAVHVRAALLLALAFALPACGRQAPPEEPAATIPVRGVDVHPEDEAGEATPVGSLRSERQAILAAKVMGTITEIRKRSGEPVRRGEIVVVIDDREVAGQILQAEGALAQARAAAVLAETNLGRYQRLFERGSASQLELDQSRFQAESARGAVAQAEGAVATARSYRSYAEIPAPFDGHVVDLLCEVGDLASPGRPLLTIEDERTLRLHVSLPERELGAAVPGAAVRVRVPALDDRLLEGRVGEVVPAVDPATRTFTVKIDLPADPALRSGLYARAEFATGSRKTLRVPAAAVVERGGLVGVLVVEDGRARFRLVTLGEADGGTPPSRTVLSGVASGETVLLDPPLRLAEGTPVEVRP
jgi:RND family efflux transporter MFP subunit